MSGVAVAELRRERLAELAELRQAGRKVIGYCSHFIPVEVIRAAGAIPLRLMRGGYDAETAGLSFLRPDACPYCLATLGNFALARRELKPRMNTDEHRCGAKEEDGQGPAGENWGLDFYAVVDAFASVNTCDLSRRLPESIHQHFRLPVFELYLPRTAEPLPHRLEEFWRQLEWFGRELASFCGTTVDDDRLAAAIQTENKLRDALRRLAAAGPAESAVLDFVTLATTMHPERFTLYASRFTPDSPSPFPPPQGGGNEKEGVTRGATPKEVVGRPRLMLLGSELAEQDRWLVETIEAQADIVADLISEGRAWFADSCPESDDPLADLARFYFSRLPGIFRRPNDATYNRIRELAAEHRVYGIVLKTLLYCDPWNMEEVRLRREIGLPLLHIDGNYAPENREQVRTRIEAFLESLED